MIKKGIYRHFKGGIYEVIGNAIYTETGESLVLYRIVNNHSPIYARPLKFWNRSVNGEKRFELIKGSETE